MNNRTEKDHRRHAAKSDSGCKVFLGGLLPKWTEKDVEEFISQFGTVLGVSIVRTHTGESKGFGFAVFQTAEQAASALGAFQFGHRTLEIKPSIKQNGDISIQSHRTAWRTPKDGPIQNPTTASLESESTTPSSQTLKSNAKLSKHSKNFETSPACSVKIPSFREGDIRIHVIDLSSETKKEGAAGAHPATAQPQALAKPPKKCEEKSGGMSKLSKEFHLPQVTNVDREVLPIQPFLYNPGQSLLANPYLSFSAVDGRCAIESSRHLLSGPAGHFAQASDLRINFFTFPGRE